MEGKKRGVGEEKGETNVGALRVSKPSRSSADLPAASNNNLSFIPIIVSIRTDTSSTSTSTSAREREKRKNISRNSPTKKKIESKPFSRMSARPPPARPHIGLNPRISSFGTSSEWVEEDAWDSASDSESPQLNKSWNTSRQQSTAPKNVPGKIARSSSSSSSNLASSYTHINAPNPSSYPSKLDLPPPPKGGGWTLVKTSDDTDQKSPLRDLKDSDIDHDTLAASTTSEVAEELVVGDFDDPDVLQGQSLRAKESQSTVRDQVDEIVAGLPGNRVSNPVFSDMTLSP